MKLLIITAGIIFGPLIILGIAKIISKMSGTVKKANPFKFLGSVFSKPKKLIMWAMIGAIFYGGYLLACYLWPTPERLAFKELSRNLAEIELKTEKSRLAAFNEKVKNGERLTEAEKREAMEADKKIEKVRKDYSDGKLISPPPKTSAKPKKEVWDWVFKWERNGKQWEEAKSIGRKKKGEKYPAKILEQTPNYIKMEYISGYSGKAEEVLLKVGDTGDFWAADYFVKNKNPKEIDLSLKVSLHKDPESLGNFTGIFWQDQDGQQVDCWLSKK